MRPGAAHPPAADRTWRRSAASVFGMLQLLGAALPGSTPLAAQAPPPATGGAIELSAAVRGLGVDKRVLVIGAHPDDEDTSLLAVLARGEGAQAAYLSLTRGEGGQNLIGEELGPGLGLLRTEELLAARRTDGARQYFARAIDYGYSKTLEEALTFWPRDSLLKDVVRVVRRFRPQVVVTIFSGTPSDGHGQHQAAGWVAREAYRVAGDPAVFPELATEEGLAPWSPLRLFQSARFNAEAATDSLDAGALDATIGQSYHQIAMRSRSLHRSQDMGQLQEPGPRAVRLEFLEARVGGPGLLFDGIDTTLTGALGQARAAQLLRLGRSLGTLGAGSGTQAAPLLDSAWALLEADNAGTESQRGRLARAEAIFRGLAVDFRVPAATAVPGSTMAAEVVLWNAGPLPLEVSAVVRVAEGSGWHAPPVLACRTIAPGRVATDTVELRLDASAPTTDPYFLRRPPHGWLYDWTAVPPAVRGEPFGPPALELEVSWCGGGPARVLARRPVTHRENDQALGEVRRPLVVVPRVGVRAAPDVLLWSTARADDREVRVTLTHHAREATRGQVSLELPTGWLGGDPVSFELAPGGTRVVSFLVRPGPGAAAGTHELRAVAIGADGTRWDAGVEVIDYPHVAPRAHTVPAHLRGAVVDLAPLAFRRIGYVRGAADRVPEALRALGLPVELLDPATLLQGDLSAYDAIVVGSRAYEVDPALVQANERLLAYVAAGGLVLTQYQQQSYFVDHRAPPGLEPARPDTVRGRPAFPRFERVTDETAEVRLLVPGHPALSQPHLITPGDWEGWVQERGLYFAPAWSDAWTPLLEMRDPGEPPQRGALLVTRHGRGTYVYTGLSFFRELPAGVPGAWRLFLNLLALGTDPTS